MPIQQINMNYKPNTKHFLIMGRTNQNTGANQPNPVAAPTMADFNVFLADAMQQYGTATYANGDMNDDETAATTLSTIADLADFMPISTNRLADLMDVVNEYAVTACTMERQGKANRAHDTLTRLISLYMNVTEMRQELQSLNAAAFRFGEVQKAYNLAEYCREQEGAETDNTRNNDRQHPKL